MAPQTSIPIAANVLGTIGTVFWCIQLLPQIWYNWKQKKTDGLPGLMMFIWAVSAVPFGVYAIVQKFNIPIQIQPQIFCCLALVSWTQVLIYNKSVLHSPPPYLFSPSDNLQFSAWPVWKASLLATGVGAFFGGVQLLLVLTLRGPYNRGVEWPMTLVGVISAVLLAGGLIPPYFEIAKRSDFVFLSIDWLGAFFSLMALVAQHTFDVLGGVQYIVCLLLEFGIFTSHLLFLLRTRSLRRRAKESNTPFDDMPEARKFVFPRPDATTARVGEELADVEKGEVATGEAQADREEMIEGEDDEETVAEMEKRREKVERRRSSGAGRWPSRQ
ncbi:MAG: hypothetical protein L6R39_005964 [Caloplaca ligustica]|nr:MAG: hypothetical protein L6R39_005964 [Caloplaca ligustica]